MIKDLSKILREPLLRYIVSEHMSEIDRDVEELLTDYIDEFLQDELGELNQDTRKKLTKELLKQVL